MALRIASYNDLVREVKSWSNRKDITDDQISSFVYLTGNAANQVLRTPAMEDTQILTVEDSHLIIPADFVELRSLTAQWNDNQSVPLERVSMEVFLDRHNRLVPGDPIYYTRQGPYWLLSPATADGVQATCHYYRSMPDIDENNQTNWLLDMSPASYLFGTLHYLYLFVMEDDKAAYWGEKFQNEVERIQALADKAEYSGTRLVVRDKEL